MKLLTAAITCCSFAAPAGATYFNATYACGHGESVWIANPVVGHGADRERKLIIEMRADFDRPTVVRFDPATDEVTLNGRACHPLKEKRPG
jgi:hypothetical protein